MRRNARLDRALDKAALVYVIVFFISATLLLIAAWLALFVWGMALPAQAHTQAEQREWEAGWVQEVKSRGLTPALLDEYLDFQERHAPPPPPRAITAPTSSPSSSVNRGMGSNVEQWRGLVAAYFSEVDRALCIMAAESGGNPNAVNPSSGAAGLFQIMPFWWDHFGGDRFNPETNVRVAATILGLQGWGAWSPWNRGMCR